MNSFVKKTIERAKYHALQGNLKHIKYYDLVSFVVVKVYPNVAWDADYRSTAGNSYIAALCCDKDAEFVCFLQYEPRKALSSRIENTRLKGCIKSIEFVQKKKFHRMKYELVGSTAFTSDLDVPYDKTNPFLDMLPVLVIEEVRFASLGQTAQAPESLLKLNDLLVVNDEPVVTVAGGYYENKTDSSSVIYNARPVNSFPAGSIGACRNYSIPAKRGFPVFSLESEQDCKVKREDEDP